MDQTIELNDNLLDSIFCLDENEKDDMLQFMTSEIVRAQSNVPIEQKISDYRLIRIFSYLLLGQKIWNTKTLYSVKDFDSILDLYDRAPMSVQAKLDDLMEIFKIEIYGSID